MTMELFGRENAELHAGTVVNSGAVFHPDGDADGPYRFLLWRVWNTRLPCMIWIMLNPSTADAADNDATIRRCIGFARRLGFGGIKVVNLFALRSRDPRALDASTVDPIGPGNDRAIREACAMAEPGAIFCGWGSHRTPLVMQRAAHVVETLLPRRPVFTLRILKGGAPGHPLFVPYVAAPVEFAAARLRA